MKSETNVVLTKLRNFKAVEEDDWIKLEDTLAQLWETDEPELGMIEMFSILENYTDEEGGSALWSILHGLESLPNYEKYLLESVNRKPSDFNLMMLNRILNINQTTIHDQLISDVIKLLLINNRLSERLIYRSRRLIDRIK